MVEFALVLAPLLLVLVGIFDLGRGVYYAHVLENAAREGARVGVVETRTADEICARAIRAAVLPDVPASNRCGTTGGLTVAVPNRGKAGSPSQPVRVTVSYTFRPATPVIGQIIGDQVTLSASCTMYVEE